MIPSVEELRAREDRDHRGQEREAGHRVPLDEEADDDVDERQQAEHRAARPSRLAIRSGRVEKPVSIVSASETSFPNE